MVASEVRAIDHTVVEKKERRAGSSHAGGTQLDVLSANFAVAHIEVAADAFVGTREAVLFAPMAESQGVVTVVKGQGGVQPPPSVGHRHLQVSWQGDAASPNVRVTIESVRLSARYA